MSTQSFSEGRAEDPLPIPDYRTILRDIIVDRKAFKNCRNTGPGAALEEVPYSLENFEALLAKLGREDSEPRVFRPEMDLCEELNRVVIFVEIPGVEDSKLQLKLVPDIKENRHKLLVYGNRTKPEPPLGMVQQRGPRDIQYGGFCRVINIVSDIYVPRNKDPIDQFMNNGILEIRLGKDSYRRDYLNRGHLQARSDENTPLEPKADLYEGPVSVMVRVEMAGAYSNRMPRVERDDNGIIGLRLVGYRRAQQLEPDAMHRCIVREIKYGDLDLVINIGKDIVLMVGFPWLSDPNKY